MLGGLALVPHGLRGLPGSSRKVLRYCGQKSGPSWREKDNVVCFALRHCVPIRGTNGKHWCSTCGVPRTIHVLSHTPVAWALPSSAVEQVSGAQGAEALVQGHSAGRVSWPSPAVLTFALHLLGAPQTCDVGGVGVTLFVSKSEKGRFREGP